MPMISVIVPVYYVEKYIHRCVDRILAQTFTDFVLILVDDGSSDDCGRICDDYAKNDNRIIIMHKQNGGLSDARNKGIELVINDSYCKWITFIDSDDWIELNYLELLYECFKTEGVDVSCCKYEECKYEDTSLKNSEQELSNYNGKEFCVKEYKYSQTAWGKLFKIEQWRNHRFPMGKIHEDAFTIYKILLPAKKIAFISSPPLYFFNSENNDSITRQRWSPRRMDLLCAIEEKIEYSKINGYDEYYWIQVREYINVLGYNYVQAKANKRDAILKTIRKKLRKALAKKDFKTEFPFVEKYFWVYDIAYPSTMKIYWTLKSVNSKIKRG